MIWVMAILLILLVLPVVLFVAVALGPVAVGILCAVGFGLIVFVLFDALAGLGRAARSAERAAEHRLHHPV